MENGCDEELVISSPVVASLGKDGSIITGVCTAGRIMENGCDEELVVTSPVVASSGEDGSIIAGVCITFFLFDATG